MARKRIGVVMAKYRRKKINNVGINGGVNGSNGNVERKYIAA
jgi:hypothetical protein